MSALSLLLSDVLRELYSPATSLYDQHFGLGLVDDELRGPRLMSVPLHCGYLRPWRHLSVGNSGVSSFQHDKSNFRVSLDVQQFKPEEISVKVVGDYVVVEAQHEEREDVHGFISRQFTRRYKMPNDIDVDELKSTLSSDGVLILTAPKKEVIHGEERSIPIIQTNAPVTKKGGEDGKGERKDERMES